MEGAFRWAHDTPLPAACYVFPHSCPVLACPVLAHLCGATAAPLPWSTRHRSLIDSLRLRAGNVADEGVSGGVLDLLACGRHLGEDIVRRARHLSLGLLAAARKGDLQPNPVSDPPCIWLVGYFVSDTVWALPNGSIYCKKWD